MKYRGICHFLVLSESPPLKRLHWKLPTDRDYFFLQKISVKFVCEILPLINNITKKTVISWKHLFPLLDINHSKKYVKGESQLIYLLDHLECSRCNYFTMNTQTRYYKAFLLAQMFAFMWSLYGRKQTVTNYEC